MSEVKKDEKGGEKKPLHTKLVGILLAIGAVWIFLMIVPIPVVGSINSASQGVGDTGVALSGFRRTGALLAKGVKDFFHAAGGVGVQLALGGFTLAMIYLIGKNVKEALFDGGHVDKPAEKKPDDKAKADGKPDDKAKAKPDPAHP